jgi:hypothetical protein
MDMRRILLLLPFLLDGLLTDTREEQNSGNPLGKVSGLSPKMVNIAVMPLLWHHLCCRRIPSKDEEDSRILETQREQEVLA